MIVYVLCGIIVLQFVIHHFERKDLYSRLRSKNLTEYKGEATVYTPSAHQAVLNRWRRKEGEKEE